MSGNDGPDNGSSSKYNPTKVPDENENGSNSSGRVSRMETSDGQIMRQFAKQQTLLSERDASSPPKAVKSSNRALFLFAKENKFRILMARISTTSAFTTAVLIVIMVNCVFLALDDGNAAVGSPMYQAIQNAEYIFTVLFTIEFMVKVVAQGFLFNGKHSYLKDPWNILDFMVVCTVARFFLSCPHLNLHVLLAGIVVVPFVDGFSRKFDGYPHVSLAATAPSCQKYPWHACDYFCPVDVAACSAECSAAISIFSICVWNFGHSNVWRQPEVPVCFRHEQN